MKTVSILFSLVLVVFLASCGSDEHIIEFGANRSSNGPGPGPGPGPVPGPDPQEVLPANVQLLVDEYLGSYTMTNVREVFGADCNQASFTVTQVGRVLSVSQRDYRCQGNTTDTGYPLEITVGDDASLSVDGEVRGSITADVLSIDDFFTYGNCTENDFSITLIDPSNSGVFDFMCNTQYTFLGDL